jgi:hypothetical protein
MSSKISDAFANITASFKELRFLESDNESATSQLTEDLSNLLMNDDLPSELNVLTSINGKKPNQQPEKPVKGKKTPQKGEVSKNSRIRRQKTFHEDEVSKKPIKKKNRDPFSMVELLPYLETVK